MGSTLVGAMASVDPAVALSLSQATGVVRSALPVDPLKDKIEALKAEQEAMRAKKKELRKAMKNAKRQQSRLKKRARLMSDEDLVAVLLMRRGRKEESSGAFLSTTGCLEGPRPESENGGADAEPLAGAEARLAASTGPSPRDGEEELLL